MSSLADIHKIDNMMIQDLHDIHDIHDINDIEEGTLTQLIKDFEDIKEPEEPSVICIRNAYIARDIQISRRDKRKIRQELLKTEEKLKMFFNEEQFHFQSLHNDALNCNLFSFYYRLNKEHLFVAGY